MANLSCSKSTIHSEFFKPLFEALANTKGRRDCPVLDDSIWLEAGVRRCLELVQSGRDFLQYLADTHDTSIRVSTFFESLKSKRRGCLLDEVLNLVRGRMKRVMPDPFAGFKCLDDFDLYAGDGHFVGAACHDKAVPRKGAAPEAKAGTSRQATTKYATGHIYTLDLRTHAMSHLAVADQITRKKEHEMRALKRQTIASLRQGADKGRKALYVWDRAGIDFLQWYDWKSRSGIYFLSREKSNMKLHVLGENPFDAAAPENAGVQADQIMGTNCGVSVRRVTYVDPETGITYYYLTNLPTSIPPGVVALLFKSRWDIEKVFDEFKNKLGETKSWASSPVAKTNQARLLCLTHNLMTLMEQTIWQRDQVRNHAELKRRSTLRQTRSENLAKTGGGIIPHIQHAADRLSLRTVKFIRWLRNHLDLERAWDAAIARLSHIYEHP